MVNFTYSTGSRMISDLRQLSVKRFSENLKEQGLIH